MRDEFGEVKRKQEGTRVVKSEEEWTTEVMGTAGQS